MKKNIIVFIILQIISIPIYIMIIELDSHLKITMLILTPVIAIGVIIIGHYAFFKHLEKDNQSYILLEEKKYEELKVHVKRFDEKKLNSNEFLFIKTRLLIAHLNLDEVENIHYLIKELKGMEKHLLINNIFYKSVEFLISLDNNKIEISLINEIKHLIGKYKIMINQNSLYYKYLILCELLIDDKYEDEFIKNNFNDLLIIKRIMENRGIKYEN